ncbi:PREDICTED: uncharacterized protein LOC104800831 isoform X2 [Tarenaya hassleriana]|uniref:uncharacterized protein LOC104800831 isoform X2 n=1 Tax=Tarenaya hassleriana TaxID=28532 RepID=UPI00053C7C21|nr:PREDICTED: uncharacterized protein LOC104800831 isoform X2 [Tarenaya hassleriana]
MELEAVTAKRRLAAIAGHFPPATCDSVSPASILPLHCSSSLNSVIRRCDNRMNFARQASSAQSYFMRQASADERTIPQNCAPPRCSSTRMNGFPAASESPLFSRPSQGLSPQFSKPAKEGSCLSSDPNNQQMKNWKSPSSPNPGLPKFARTGTGWSPSSDIAESEGSYIMTVELPGANVEDLRVEVDNRNLTVTGRRFAIFQRVAAGSKDSIYGYHKREILQGPFQVSWPLPSNVNKDNVCAEFLNGLLRIVIPKL